MSSNCSSLQENSHQHTKACSTFPHLKNKSQQNSCMTLHILPISSSVPLPNKMPRRSWFFQSLSSDSFFKLIHSGSADFCPSMIHLIQDICNKEGKRDIFRGVTPDIVKVLPVAYTGYVTFEKVKWYLGLTYKWNNFFFHYYKHLYYKHSYGRKGRRTRVSWWKWKRRVKKLA